MDRGWSPVLATHRSFQPACWHDLQAVDTKSRESSRLPILPVFRHTTYQPDSYLAGLQQITRSQSTVALADQSELNFPRRMIRQANLLLHHRRREWFVRQFAADCSRVFQQVALSPGDHVFLTTISELELMGLSLFLANHQASLQCHWHLQFHFNLFAGRPGEYRRQAAIGEAINACFLASLSRLNYHSLHFYTTSETLADQYNLLDVGEFHSLPYPIAPEFEPAPITSPTLIPFNADQPQAGWNDWEADSPPNNPANFVDDKDDPFSQRDPLRLTCPGGIRREKGQANYLQQLVDQLWDSHFSTSELQLIVQRPGPKWPRKSHKFDLNLPDTDPASGCSPVVYLPHPLPQSEYVDLIRRTDIGLLYYNQDTYFSRRAGVLGELLSCGKPVIVSAGTWLADQIQEPIHRYLSNLEKSLPASEEINLNAMSWNSRNIPLPGGVVSFDQKHHPFEAKFEHEAGNLGLIEFDWHWPYAHGVYCRIEIVTWQQGTATSNRVQIVGQRRAGRRSCVAFRMPSGTTQLSLRFTNAFDDSTASIRNLRVKIWQLDDHDSIPLGQVGLIAADENQIAACVEEITEHYPHYHQTACSFANKWYARHDPQLTLDYLLSVDHHEQRQVA